MSTFAGRAASASRIESKRTSIAGNTANFVLIKNSVKNEEIVLNNIHVYVITDATVATRAVRLSVYDKEGQEISRVYSCGITASNSRFISFTETCHTQNNNTNYASDVQCLPVSSLKFGDYITLDLDSGVAGDSYRYNLKAMKVKIKTNV